MSGAARAAGKERYGVKLGSQSMIGGGGEEGGAGGAPVYGIINRRCCPI